MPGGAPKLGSSTGVDSNVKRVILPQPFQNLFVGIVGWGSSRSCLGGLIRLIGLIVIDESASKVFLHGESSKKRKKRRKLENIGGQRRVVFAIVGLQGK